MKLQENYEKMMRLVSSWRESGQTQREFAKSHQITLSKLRYWASKYKKENRGENPFIQLESPLNENIHILFPNGVELNLPPGTPFQELKKLIGWRG